MYRQRELELVMLTRGHWQSLTHKALRSIARSRILWCSTMDGRRPAVCSQLLSLRDSARSGLSFVFESHRQLVQRIEFVDVDNWLSEPEAIVPAVLFNQEYKSLRPIN